MKKIMKLISVALVLVMLAASFAACSDPEKAGGIVSDPYAGKTHAEISDEIYEKVLGEFDTAYKAAKEAKTVAERFALMAIAEAKLLESGVMLPSTSKGGNYAISKVAPYTATPVLWGNDSYRYYRLLIVAGDKPIKAAERNELKALWNAKKGTGTYYEEAVYRCAAYQEDGYPAGRWRLPTRGEIKFIAMLSANKAFTFLFSEGGYYWSANGAVKVVAGGVEDVNEEFALGRCVYDIWYWGEQDQLTGENRKVFTWGDRER